MSVSDSDFASISKRHAILVILKAVGLGLIMLAAFPLIFIGYFYSASAISYAPGWFLFGSALLVIGLGMLVVLLAMAISRWRWERSRYQAVKIAVIAFALALVFCPFVLRKRTVPLMSGGKTTAVAKHPFLWGDIECPVYAGDIRFFSLWSDMFDTPWFIYPFADGRRFLCIYDNDTSVLVFVVDCRTKGANGGVSFGWPPDSYVRNYMADTAPKVVTNPAGIVRLPSLEEVKEAAKYIENLTPAQFERASFPTLDMGLYRFYIPKADLLKQLDPNRKSVWP